MVTTTTTITQKVESAGIDRLALSGAGGNIADWHRDLIRDGFAVVKGAVPRERADAYANEMFSWLEGL
jgi:hypothetical protein